LKERAEDRQREERKLGRAWAARPANRGGWNIGRTGRWNQVLKEMRAKELAMGLHRGQKKPEGEIHP